MNKTLKNVIFSPPFDIKGIPSNYSKAHEIMGNMGNMEKGKSISPSPKTPKKQKKVNKHEQKENANPNNIEFVNVVKHKLKKKENKSPSPLILNKMLSYGGKSIKRMRPNKRKTFRKKTRSS